MADSKDSINDSTELLHNESISTIKPLDTNGNNFNNDHHNDNTQGENGHEQNGDNNNNDEQVNKEIQECEDHLPPEIIQSTEIDQRSVYIKNVDYSSTKEEVQEFFKSCGKITRVTIITDKYTGQPKGFAYIEFADKEGVENAKLLSDSMFKGRVINVMPKRTNMPYRGRGRGGRRIGRGGYFPMRRGYRIFHARGIKRGYSPYQGYSLAI